MFGPWLDKESDKMEKGRMETSNIIKPAGASRKWRPRCSQNLTTRKLEVTSDSSFRIWWKSPHRGAGKGWVLGEQGRLAALPRNLVMGRRERTSQGKTVLGFFLFFKKGNFFLEDPVHLTTEPTFSPGFLLISLALPSLKTTTTTTKPKFGRDNEEVRVTLWVFQNLTP